MLFYDRKEAGKYLGIALAKYSGQDTLVYALPRGGVVVGFEVARILGAPLDLIITRKIGHPKNPEYAVCALTEDGALICNEQEKQQLNSLWLDQAVTRERQEAQRRRFAYLDNQPRTSAQGKIAILVDDGIATGLTMEAAILTLQKDHPRSIIIAAPVAPQSVIEPWKRKGLSVIVLEEASPFQGSVGAYYISFPQVQDIEVIDLLRRARSSIGKK